MLVVVNEFCLVPPSTSDNQHIRQGEVQTGVPGGSAEAGGFVPTFVVHRQRWAKRGKFGGNSFLSLAANSSEDLDPDDGAERCDLASDIAAETPAGSSACPRRKGIHTELSTRSVSDVPRRGAQHFGHRG